MNRKYIKNYYDVVFGGLLHDIGKSLQRGESRFVKHNKYGAEYIRNNLGDDFKDIATIVERHHDEYDDLDGEMKEKVKFIRKADGISASLRSKGSEDSDLDDKNEGANRNNLIFNMLKYEQGIKRGVKEDDKGYRYDLTVLTAPYERQVKIDLSSPTKNKYKSLNKLLLDERNLKLIKNMYKHEKKFALNYLDVLLKESTFFVPSDTRGKGHYIPLYSHLHGAAAVASCLLSKKDKPFLFVSGIIGGKQNFITKLNWLSEERKNITRIMRGRSFFINLVVDIIVNHILNHEKINLPNIHIIQESAGKFLLMLPNTSDTMSALKSIKKEIVNEIEKYNLSFRMVTYEASMEEVMYKNDQKFVLMEKLAGKDREEKYQHHSDDLETYFDIPKIDKIKKCKICGKFMNEGEICDTCSITSELGRIINGGNRYIVAIMNKKLKNSNRISKAYLNFLGWEINVISENDLKGHIKEINSKLVSLYINSYHLRDGDKVYLDYLNKDPELIFSLKTKLISIPKENGDVLRFDKDKSYYVGHILLDGDGFGQIIRENVKSIEDLLIFSNMIDWIFNKQVGEKLALNNNKVYTVYMGGDDIYLIARYQDIFKKDGVLDSIKTAIEESSRGTISASGGILVTKDKFPIWIAKELVNKEEKRAKEKKKTATTEKTVQSNIVKNEESYISIFGDTHKAKEVIDIGDRIQNEIIKAKDNEIETTIYYNILRDILALERISKREKLIAHIHYWLKRKEKNCKTPVEDVNKAIKDNFKKLFREYSYNKGNSSKMKMFINHLLLMKRIKKEVEKND